MTIHLLTMAGMAKCCPKINMSLFVKEMVIFADVQYCIYTDMVGGWVRKVQKYPDIISGWYNLIQKPEF